MIDVTKTELREAIRSVLASRFIENDEEYLEDTIDEIVAEVEGLEGPYDETEE